MHPLPQSSQLHNAHIMPTKSKGHSTTPIPQKPIMVMAPVAVKMIICTGGPKYTDGDCHLREFAVIVVYQPPFPKFGQRNIWRRLCKYSLPSSSPPPPPPKDKFLTNIWSLKVFARKWGSHLLHFHFQ